MDLANFQKTLDDTEPEFTHLIDVTSLDLNIPLHLDARSKDGWNVVSVMPTMTRNQGDVIVGRPPSPALMFVFRKLLTPELQKAIELSKGINGEEVFKPNRLPEKQ